MLPRVGLCKGNMETLIPNAVEEGGGEDMKRWIVWWWVGGLVGRKGEKEGGKEREREQLAKGNTWRAGK